MVAYLVDANAILAQPYCHKLDADMNQAYDAIMTRITSAGLMVTTHVLDNDCSVAFKQAIQAKGATIQKVPPHVHRCNAAARAIHTQRPLCGNFGRHCKIISHERMGFVYQASQTYLKSTP